MASEIQIQAITGLTVQVQIYNGSTPVGSPISTTEVGTTGSYFCSVPNGTPYGHYLLVASAVGGDAPVIGSGEIWWQGHYELTDALAKVQGLDHANAATTTPNSLDAGNIHVTITGDQITNTVLTADI